MTQRQDKGPEGGRAGVPCRDDCVYYSAYTKTCDYALIMGRTRGCPRDSCVRYRPAGEGGKKTARALFDDEGYVRPVLDRPGRRPEPPVEPPEAARYITAGCGHEVYEGEELYESEEGTLCRECLEDLIRQMPLRELAELVGCACLEVAFPTGSGDGEPY